MSGKQRLEIGDTIACSNMRELKTLATNLTNKGYGVECKGWEGIRQCKLTITKVPEEENECDYCRLEPNGDIPQDSKDLFWDVVVIPGEALTVQLGNNGNGFGLMITNSDNEPTYRKLNFNYCPMCGRRIET